MLQWIILGLRGSVMITAEPSTSWVEQYAAEAASAYFLTRADVMVAGRSVVFVEARRAMWKRFADDSSSTSSIVRAVGRHHTTVMHALKTTR